MLLAALSLLSSEAQAILLYGRLWSSHQYNVITYPPPENGTT